MQEEPKIRLKDIAKYAEVSVATVSMALADHPQVNEETRRKVKLASRKLGYKKSPRLFPQQNDLRLARKIGCREHGQPCASFALG